MRTDKTTIYKGQRVIVDGEFRLAGVPTDPVVVRCLVRAPGGGLSIIAYPSADMTRREAGIYEAYVTVDAAGTWSFRWEGAGTVDAVDEISVEVRPSAVNA